LPIIPECLACGACCFSLLATYVRVSGHDHARLGDRAQELVWFDENRAYMRMADGHCSALRIDAISGQFFCSTYQTRPDVCRDLARGSGACRGELDAKSLRPLLELGRRRRELA
jgi:Fe-S-cluster containining protein